MQPTKGILVAAAFGVLFAIAQLWMVHTYTEACALMGCPPETFSLYQSGTCWCAKVAK